VVTGAGAVVTLARRARQSDTESARNARERVPPVNNRLHAAVSAGVSLYYCKRARGRAGAAVAVQRGRVSRKLSRAVNSAARHSRQTPATTIH
jgi:hypothetical protein